MSTLGGQSRSTAQAQERVRRGTASRRGTGSARQPVAQAKRCGRLPAAWVIGRLQAAAGHGKYHARSIAPARTHTPAAGLTAANLGVEAAADDMLFLHLGEVGEATNWLVEDGARPYVLGIVVGRANGKMVVVGVAAPVLIECDEEGG